MSNHGILRSQVVGVWRGTCRTRKLKEKEKNEPGAGGEKKKKCMEGTHLLTSDYESQGKGRKIEEGLLRISSPQGSSQTLLCT